MISSSTSREALPRVSGLSAIGTIAGPASDRSQRRPSPACRPKIPRAGVGASAAFVLTCVLLVMSAVPAAASDPGRPGGTGPDPADLRYFIDCSTSATTRILSFDEAAGCARVFLRIKLSFVAGIGPDAFDALPPQEKAAINLVGYRRYLDWRADNAVEVEALGNAPMSSSGFRGN